MAYLQNLALRQFRNYESLRVEFAPGANVLLGANGQGKTNLLEAIGFLSLLRSFRTTLVSDLWRWHTRQFVIVGEFDGGPCRRLAVEYGEKRRLRADGQGIGRASDFIGRFFCAAFVPEDIGLPRGAGSARRRFLDSTLSQLYPEYLAVLQDYTRALKSRHLLLRAETVDEAALRAYDGVLANRGGVICRYRAEFAVTFAPYITKAAAEFYPPAHELALPFRPSLRVEAPTSGAPLTAADYEVALAAALVANRERDRHRQQTCTGPHRDDFGFTLNGQDLERFGSEGQCRLAVMALKTALTDLLLAQRRDQAVLMLVDDVIGELDERGRRAFFAALRRADQVFLAATDKRVLDLLPGAAVFAVAGGTVTRR